MALSIPPNKLLIFGALALGAMWYAKRAAAQQPAAPRPAQPSSAASAVGTLLSFLGSLPGEPVAASGVPSWDAALGRAWAARPGGGAWLGEGAASGIAAWDDALARAVNATTSAMPEPVDYGQYF